MPILNNLLILTLLLVFESNLLFAASKEDVHTEVVNPWSGNINKHSVKVNAKICCENEENKRKNSYRTTSGPFETFELFINMSTGAEVKAYSFEDKEIKKQYSCTKSNINICWNAVLAQRNENQKHTTPPELRVACDLEEGPGIQMNPKQKTYVAIAVKNNGKVFIDGEKEKPLCASTKIHLVEETTQKKGGRQQIRTENNNEGNQEAVQ